MTAQHFSIQMARLERQFGKFGQERGDLLWKEIQDYDPIWFARTVDKFIGENRVMPLLPEFRTEIAIERERIYAEKKKQQTREAEEFMSPYPAEEIQSICRQIRDRIMGKMRDEDFKSFQSALKATRPPNK